MRLFQKQLHQIVRFGAPIYARVKRKLDTKARNILRTFVPGLRLARAVKTAIGSYDPMSVTTARVKRKLDTKARNILRAFVPGLRLAQAVKTAIGSYNPMDCF